MSVQWEYDGPAYDDAAEALSFELVKTKGILNGLVKDISANNHLAASTAYSYVMGELARHAASLKQINDRIQQETSAKFCNYRARMANYKNVTPGNYPNENSPNHEEDAR